MDLWRISKYHSISGEGGLHYSARWHTAGKRIVYLAESPAGAMIEVLVHLEMNEHTWPVTYDLLRIAAPDTMEVETIQATHEDMRKLLLIRTREMGDKWLRSKRTPLARVPSAILPHTWNVLLNSEHPAANELRVIETIQAEYDTRLFLKLR